MIWDEFYSHVLPWVEGCPDMVALDHIKKAAREFCARTNCWNREPETLLTTANVDVYPLDLDEGSELVKLMGLVIDGSEYETPTQIKGRLMRKRAQHGQFAYIEGKQDLVVYPAPNVDGLDIFMQMSIKPSLTAEEFDDELIEYVPDIAHGAIASLCTLPRKAWTSLDQAELHTGKFNSRITSVALATSNGNNNQSRRRNPGFL